MLLNSGSWYATRAAYARGRIDKDVTRKARKVNPMHDRAFIRNTLIEILEADTGEKHSDLEDAAGLRDSLGLDSVDVVSIVSQVERRFHIRMTHQELEKLVTVGDVLNLLETKLNAPPVPSPSIAPPAAA